MLQLPSASPGGAAPSVSEGGAEAAGPRLRHRRWSEQFWRPARDLSVKGDVPVSPVAPRKCQDILYEQVGARSILYAPPPGKLGLMTTLSRNARGCHKPP